MVKNNKVAFKNKLMEEIKQSKSDSKFLDRMEKKSNDTLFKQAIKDQRWVSHFKSIFNSPTGNKPLPENTAEYGELDSEITLDELKIGAYVLRL